MKKVFITIIFIETMIIVFLGINLYKKNNDKCVNEPKSEEKIVKEYREIIKYQCTKLEVDNDNLKMYNKYEVETDLKGVITSLNTKIENKYTNKDDYLNEKEIDKNEENVIFDDNNYVITYLNDSNYLLKNDEGENVIPFYYRFEESLLKDGYKCDIAE